MKCDYPNRKLLTSFLLVGLSLVMVLVILRVGESDLNDDTNGSGKFRIEKSSRKRSSDQGRGQAGMRNSDEVRAAWEELIPDHGESLFDEMEIRRFLASLSMNETESLVRELFTDESYPKAATARLLGRWGEFDALAALAFLDEMEVKNDYFVEHIYVGWVKKDVVAAFEHLERPKQIDSDHSELPFIDFSNPERRSIWRTLTTLEPELALRIIFESSEAIGGEVDSNRDALTTIDRDAIIGALPADSNWAEIAERFFDREFVSSEQLPLITRATTEADTIDLRESSEDLPALLMEKGGGSSLFARWVYQEPQVAIEWHLKRGVPLAYEGDSAGGSITQLLSSLDKQEQTKPLRWLDEQIKGGEFGVEAYEIIKSSSVSAAGSSWMGLYAQLPFREERFQVMKDAVKRVKVFYLGADTIDFTPVIPLEVIKDYLPRFGLSPSQVAEIRDELEFHEKQE